MIICNLSLCVMIHLKLTIVTVKKENASKVARAGLASKEDIAQGKTKLTGVKDIREMGGSLAEPTAVQGDHAHPCQRSEVWIHLSMSKLLSEFIHVKGRLSEFIHVIGRLSEFIRPCQRSVVRIHSSVSKFGLSEFIHPCQRSVVWIPSLIPKVSCLNSFIHVKTSWPVDLARILNLGRQDLNFFWGRQNHTCHLFVFLVIISNFSMWLYCFGLINFCIILVIFLINIYCVVLCKTTCY